MKHLIFGMTLILGMQSQAIPLIATEGVGRVEVNYRFCSPKDYSRAEAIARKQAQEKAEDICGSEVTEVGKAQIRQDCRQAITLDKYYATIIVSAKFVCGEL